MKLLRWVALVVVVVAVVATILYVRRDSIARDIANSLLEDQGLVVTALSVEALATDRLEFAELVIDSERGTRYEIVGLTVLLGAHGRTVSRIAAEHLVVKFGSERGEPSSLGTSLQSILNLPLVRPDIAATVARLSVPKLPELTDVAWSTSESGQDLSFEIDAISLSINVRRHDEQTHRVAIRAVHADDDEVLSAEIALQGEGETYAVNGQAAIRTSAWLPVLQPLGLVPTGLSSFDATLSGPVEIALDGEAAGHLSFNALFALDDNIVATFEAASGGGVKLQAHSLDALSVGFDYPALDWTARAGRIETTLGTDGIRDLPVKFSNFACQSGIQCTMHVLVEARKIHWNGLDFDTANFSLPIEIDVGETTRIDVSSAATAAFTGLRKSELAAGSVDLTAFSGTQLTITDEAWRCHIDRLQLAVDELTGIGKLVVSAPLTFTDFDVRESASVLSARVSLSPNTVASWEEMLLSLPGADGSWSIRDEQFAASFEVVDRHDALMANVEVFRDLTSEQGSLTVQNATMLFGRAKLSDFATGWPYSWDLVDGTWNTLLKLNWRTDGTATQYGGEMTHTLQSLAGKYEDIAFVGLDTEIELALDSVAGVNISPSSIAIGLLDVGLPIERLTADYAVDASKRSVHIEDLSMAALGGEFTADPFDFSMTEDASLATFRARSVQLQLMVDIAEFEDVEVTGAVSGVLPVTIRGDKIRIEDGRLESDSPGGVIRYRAGDVPLDAIAGDSGLNIVTEALGNFEFETLTSDVNYAESGDLKLQMSLSGINPDMDATQPIVLNLGIENNVPQLLRSLQAIRSIEDILERQTAN